MGDSRGRIGRLGLCVFAEATARVTTLRSEHAPVLGKADRVCRRGASHSAGGSIHQIRCVLPVIMGRCDLRSVLSDESMLKVWGNLAGRLWASVVKQRCGHVYGQHEIDLYLISRR